MAGECEIKMSIFPTDAIINHVDCGRGGGWDGMGYILFQ